MVPGIGTILAATIVAETGSVTRFRSRAAYAVYNSTAHCVTALVDGNDKRRGELAKRTAPAATLRDPLAKAYFNQCKSRGLNYNECIKRIARRMSDIVYSLLKSGRDYDRAIVEQAIQKRQEQVANAGDNRVKEALPIPDQETLSHQSQRRN
jgi:transposase